ncbi:MAG: ribosomal protein S18-alanine N-acetyltransferase [Oleispira antarctica]|uniref:[Ribosomal protein bS18]-alanine N-acetyltransferase n=1 Tax=Oleispira antarctica RB-8 TaxID=698738 RepID=R4YK72_OLEAN|nr:ribosomal protein S18-alanine N-acetyltransferase [Oleispira antarctica]MBQ0793262.1 ribosomal protein S18-alanine N-acetyltransferase [Oleispira antarctica]CCK74585.1 Peptide n-acetyltransferase [Oleispira antarctica RB-8]|tara:strand:+ start:485 stop:937 length:453 start_codon:yes stop_codon:yes gene_type:complete
MPIRLMQESDLDAVMINENAAYDFPCPASIIASNQKRYYCIVFESLAEKDKSAEILGHAILSTVVDEASVLNIAVSPKAQRQRIGYQLMENILAYAASKDCVEVFLEVRESNRPAFTMYHQFGFNEVGIRHNYYPSKQGQEDAILLACYL